MGIRRNVFASRAERENYKKLSRVWAEKYRIYPNLPFLQVFDTRDLLDPDSLEPFQLGVQDMNRLKMTSIDYVLCDEQDAPLVGVDFDGMSDGFSVGRQYRPGREADWWRTYITKLKLRVAHGSGFPYFVVEASHFEEVSADVKLTLVDGIIGSVFASRQVHARFAEGFEPEDAGWDRESFERLPAGEQHDIIQDWVLDVEVEAEMTHNPISRAAARMMRELHITRQQHEFLTRPDVPLDLPIGERVTRFNSVVKHGARCRLLLEDGTSVEREAWVPNFNAPYFGSGLGLVEDMAQLLACVALKRARAMSSRSPGSGIAESTS